jgi:hypothetical protein
VRAYAPSPRLSHAKIYISAMKLDSFIDPELNFPNVALCQNMLKSVFVAKECLIIVE